MSIHSKSEETRPVSYQEIAKAIFLALAFGPPIATISSPMMWFLLSAIWDNAGWIFLPILVVSPLATLLAAPLAWLWTRMGYVSFVSALIAGTILGAVWAAPSQFYYDLYIGRPATASVNFTDLVFPILGVGIPFGTSGACVFWLVLNRERFVIPGAQLKQMLFGFRYHIMAVLALNFFASFAGLKVMYISIESQL